ncbi:MAG: hypothetical protein HUK26_02730, partial [Duodenibacillus sp.]|nr:hypothetical protein [Duodenibacillus sp.]
STALTPLEDIKTITFTVDGATLTLKVRFHDFRTVTRSKTRDAAWASAGQVLRGALGLLAQVEVPAGGVRLMGLAVSNPPEGGGQLDLMLAARPGEPAAPRLAMASDPAPPPRRRPAQLDLF